MTEQEVEKMIEARDRKRNKTIWIVLLSVGVVFGLICALAWLGACMMSPTGQC